MAFLKILDLQNDSGIVMSFIKTTNCKSYKVERITNTEKITINAFEEPFSKQIEDKMLELNALAEKHKTKPTDMVQVSIRGKITNQKDEKILWENKVEVVEILNVQSGSKEENKVIKFGNQ